MSSVRFFPLSILVSFAFESVDVALAVAELRVVSVQKRHAPMPALFSHVRQVVVVGAFRFAAHVLLPAIDASLFGGSYTM